MDEASELVAQLQNKLDDLDRKVELYRKDLTDEFNKYADDLLRGVSDEIATTVLDALHQSTSTTGNHVTGTLLSTSPRNPHTRDDEFRGVFTPRYLPLLENVGRSQRRSSRSIFPPPLMDYKGKGKAIEEGEEEGSLDNGWKTPPLEPSPALPRATPKRKITDEQSILSDQSGDGQARRSALRRSSAESAKSPRRVRFDVGRGEVLPTSSPRPNEFVAASDIPHSSQGHGLDSDEEPESEQVGDISEDISALPFSDLGGESPPPPKKISSTQRLRALSRRPLDPDTAWIEVKQPENPLADSDEDSSDEREGPSTSTTHQSQFPEHSLNLHPQPTTTYQTQIAAPNIPDYRQKQEQESEYSTSDEDDLLTMGGNKKKAAGVAQVDENKSPGSAAMSITEAYGTKQVPASAANPPSMARGSEPYSEKEVRVAINKFKLDDHEEDDPLFKLDEELENSNAKPRLVKAHSEAETEESDTEVEFYTEKETKVDFGISKSPPIEIPEKEAKSTPRKESTGAYDGKAIGIGLVSKSVHDRGAMMGDFNTHVGSLDGGTGFDDVPESYKKNIQTSYSYSQGKSGSAGITQKRAAGQMSARFELEQLEEEEERERNENNNDN